MKRMMVALLALLIAVPVAFSQQQKVYSQQELDRMLAPIALYPDSLLSQILMAATYPTEVAEAAQWSRANPRLQGDAAVRAAENEDWDPSVKSLVAFPQVLQRMDENPQWTASLGDAFLAQQPHVMDTVQQLRRRAHAAGNLQSSEQIRVQQQGEVIYVQPVNPQVVYVPYYDPLVVYGPWWWPAYRPVVWAPWPGYVRVARPGVSVSFWWGAPVGVSAGFFFGAPDWQRRSVRVVQVNNYYYRPPVVVSRTVVVERDRWQHDPHHRRGIEYRDATVRQQFAASATERRQPAAPERREAAAPERREAATPERREVAAPERRENRYAKPPARDLQDSKVLTPPRQRQEERRVERREEKREERRIEQPQSSAAPQPQQRMPSAAAPQTPQAAQPQARPRPQEERRQAREEKREQREEARQERREERHEERQERGHGKGGDRS